MSVLGVCNVSTHNIIIAVSRLIKPSVGIEPTIFWLEARRLVHLGHEGEVLLRFELRLPDSKSDVLTTTL